MRNAFWLAMALMMAFGCKKEEKKDGGDEAPAEASPTPTPTPTPTTPPADAEGKDKPPPEKAAGDDGGDKKDADAPTLDIPTGFLRSADLRAPRRLKSVPAAELAERLNERDEFYFDIDDSDQETNCVGEEILTAKVKATKHEILIEGDVRVRGCKGDAASFEAGDLRFQIAFGCTSADFTEYDGKRWEVVKAALRDKKRSCESGKGYALGNYELDYEVKSGTATIDASIRIGFSDGSNEACQFEVVDDMIRYDDDCNDITVVDFGTEPGSFFKAEFDGVSGKDGTFGFYEDGEMTVQLNNWTGTVTFRGGNRRPIYDLSSGRDEQAGKIDAR